MLKYIFFQAFFKKSFQSNCTNFIKMFCFLHTKFPIELIIFKILVYSGRTCPNFSVMYITDEVTHTFYFSCYYTCTNNTGVVQSNVTSKLIHNKEHVLELVYSDYPFGIFKLFLDFGLWVSNYTIN